MISISHALRLCPLSAKQWGFIDESAKRRGGHSSQGARATQNDGPIKRRNSPLNVSAVPA